MFDGDLHRELGGGKGGWTESIVVKLLMPSGKTPAGEPEISCLFPHAIKVSLVSYIFIYTELFKTNKINTYIINIVK